MKSIQIESGTSTWFEVYHGTHTESSKNLFDQLKLLEGQVVKINGSKKLLFKLNSEHGVTKTIIPAVIPMSVWDDGIAEGCIISVNGVFVDV